MNVLPTSNLLLKHQPELFDRILNKKLTALQIIELLGLSMAGLAAFGGVMSAALPHWWHTVNLMWKMIVLIVGSDLLCLPALYVFSSIRGSRLTLVQLVLFVIASIATTAVVLLSLSPIAWFFTWSTGGNIDTIRVMNTLMIGFGIIFGIILLMRAFQAGYKHYKEHYPDNKSAADILLLWLLLVIVVTVQMGNKLGPWYRLQAKNEICQHDLCFPYVSQGEFAKPLEVSATTPNQLNIVSAIADGRCGFGDIRYVHGTTIKSVTTNCYANGASYECAGVLDITNIPSGTKLEFQTQYQGCDGNDVISSVVTYVKP